MTRQQGRCRILGASGSLLLLFLWACGGGAESGSHDMRLSLHDGKLSATLRQASVGEVFAELARQTGIHVQVEGAAAIETVSMEFTNLPLDEGIKRILQGKNYALTYTEETHDRRGGAKIMAVRVLPTSTEVRPSGPVSDVATGPNPRLDTSVASFLSATRDADPRARRTAVIALGYLGDESAVEALERLLLSDSDTKVRRAATEALAEIGSPQALGTLGRALKDHDLVVQQNAAEAIVAIDGEQTLTRLREAARDQ